MWWRYMKNYTDGEKEQGKVSAAKGKVIKRGKEKKEVKEHINN
jgi:hypothetical protein